MSGQSDAKMRPHKSDFLNHMETDIEYESQDSEQTLFSEELNALSEVENVIPLGFDRQIFYYFSTSTRQITSLSPGEHTRANLCGMASAPRYWENFEQFMSKEGLSWARLADHLMTQCRARGIYDPSRSRGRGAWIEGDVPILHVGDALIIDGERRSLVYPGSRYIYEADQILLQDIAPPLDTNDANWLIKVCRLLRWEKPSSGTLFSGWLAIAPICGALQWRPSIWLTGASGSGKTWVMDNIVNVCLSQIGLYVAFNTTEPGIRQALQSDARPVVFDEAERDSSSQAFRMDEIFGYQRVASSENSVQIYKGDHKQGRAKSYKPRSVFLFQSINTGLTKGADESRISVLALRDYSIASDVQFSDMETVVKERITAEFASGLISRSVRLLPVIRANAKTFSRAIATHLRSQRLGDQLGALLAGAYSLHSTRLITPEQAAEYVAREDWNEQTHTHDEKDEYKLLRFLLAANLRIGSAEIPVSRLVEAARATEHVEGMVHPETAARTLSEAGIKFAYRENIPGLYFSTNHPALKKILRGQPWDASWSRALARLPGSASGRDVIQRFALGNVARATWLPMTTVDPG
jgi:putative DNA primase/helicase